MPKLAVEPVTDEPMQGAKPTIVDNLFVAGKQPVSEVEEPYLYDLIKGRGDDEAIRRKKPLYLPFA